MRRFPLSAAEPARNGHVRPVLRSWFCTVCPEHGRDARLLFRGHLAPGSIIEAKCPRCGHLITLVA